MDAATDPAGYRCRLMPHSPKISITPEMTIAGELVLAAHSKDCAAKELVNEIYRAMAAVASTPIYERDQWHRYPASG